MTAVSHITISPTSSYLAHLTPVHTTPSPAHTVLDASNHGRPLIVYQRHLILVRVACGSNIQSHPIPFLPPIWTFDSYTIRTIGDIEFLQIMVTFSYVGNACHYFPGRGGTRLQHTIQSEVGNL